MDRHRLDVGNIRQLRNDPIDHPTALLDVGQPARKTTDTITLSLCSGTRGPG